MPLFNTHREEGKLTPTVPEMTRFWNGMNRVVDLVLLALAQGRGGEVFVPRLPACLVEVLAEAIAPGVPAEVIGIRPGEKLHEALITVAEARNIAAHDQYFVIRPTFTWWGGPGREGGAGVDDRFSYSSDAAHMLTVEEPRSLSTQLGFIG